METGPRTSPEIRLDKVWDDAWSLYTLLFRRSVLIAALVYSVIDLPDLGGRYAHRSGTRVGLELLAFLLGLAGPVLVQGSLVEIVRNVHYGKRPESAGELVARAWQRIGSLVWASLVYSFGILFGLLLLVVPGLLVASRWSLMAPLIMLEDDSAGDARRRSRELVRPFTWSVLGILLVVFIAALVVEGIPLTIVRHAHVAPVVEYAATVLASALTAPFTAHALTTIYYRLTDPDHPVIHPDVRGWRSVWAGA
jgi:hypothetical protein